MRSRGPILTMLCMAVLAIALLAVNMYAGRKLAAQTHDPAVSNAAGSSPAPAAPPAVAAVPAPAALPVTGAFNGRTAGRKGGEATVAITITDGNARGYVCDGKKLESWFEGRVDGASMTLRGKGANELTGELRDGKVTGTASVNGAKWQYSATPGPAAAIPAPPAGRNGGGAR
ncbi:hypothetical protein [Pseudonocardia acaciae]|uniref:hypothetical protein n=1 Tax=Pseudonocardia acaciae TaxID=551276 RepID=UPI0012ED77DD|nr:hypothetical protein [Pseudonocardia acaciae]